MTLDCLKCISEILSGFLTPLIAILTGYIAWKQWRDSRYKIGIDLFDRRIKIYEIVKNQLHIANKESCEKVDFDELYVALCESKFFFKKDVYNAIFEIHAKMNDNLNAISRLRDNEETKERHDLFVDVKAETSMWLLNRQKNLIDIFSKYMKLNKI
jgi:hypothetical protein